MKISGIPVKIEASFLLVLLMAMTRGSDLSLMIEWGLVVFFSILIHELGHAFAGRGFGLEPQISLYAMGGLTSWTGKRIEISPSQSIRISLAGPLSGLLLGGLVYLLAPLYHGDSYLIAVIISDLLWVNIAWSLFSLLPILPMDGGHIAESLEKWWRGKPDNLIATMLSAVAAAAVCAWAFVAGYSWIAFLTAWFLWSNVSQLISRLRQRLDQPLQERLDIAWEKIEPGNGRPLIRLSEEILARAKTSEVRRQALELAFYGYNFEKEFDEAQQRLNQYRAVFGASAYLEGYLLYNKGEYESASKKLEGAFDKNNSLRNGWLLLRALVKANRPQQVLALAAHPVFEKNASYYCLVLQNLAFEDRLFGLAAELGQQCFDQTKDPTIAYNIGCAFAMQDQLQEALQWLTRAVQGGFKDRTLIESDADLAEVRKLPEFERLYQILAENERLSA
jgi:Zn-dependent protease